MGRRGQAEILAQLGEVREHLGEPAVVSLEKGLQREQGEQLVLGVVLAGELGRVSGQSFSCQAQCFAGHGPR